MTMLSIKVNGLFRLAYGYTRLRVHMAQGTKQGLDEVKLTLQRLQRIALEASDGEDRAVKAEPIPNPEPMPKPGPALQAVPPAPPVVESRPAVQAKSRILAFGGAGLAILAVLAGVTAWMLSDRRPASPPTAATAVDMPVRAPQLPAPVTRPLGQGLSEAQSLLDAGSVSRARLVLADLAPRSPEAALMMARSYDPNYLQQLPKHDVGPDIVEAEHWYRAWHAIAWKNGMMLEADRLERIIKAMK